jgi:sugar (pentulose or hexulose) kinase
MEATPVIAIFDVGKTNKKLFLFDEKYNIVFERSARFAETIDDEGYPCENLESLRLSVFDSLMEVFRRREFSVKAINFSTYGASFVYLDKDGKPLTPLYNYLKPYPQELLDQFYTTYGGQEAFAHKTASPVLGNLNSGMQIYRIKKEKPELFGKISYALHLPQYMSYLISGRPYSDITSIGCHTNLWDFSKNDYHDWVHKEGIAEKLAPIVPSDQVVPTTFPGSSCTTGIGLHDSSAALIPYLLSFHEPFVLISTGTWSISINPFNHSPLSSEELASDSLCYMNYKGKPVKASRLFAGKEHEEQVKRIASHFQLNPLWFRNVRYNPELAGSLRKTGKMPPFKSVIDDILKESIFAKRDLAGFTSPEEAYHQLILDLVTQQFVSTGLVLKDTPVKRIFVDGGFSKNSVFMHLLASFYPEMEIFAASMAQATAVGTALAIHKSWNTSPLPADIIKLRLYSLTSNVAL